MSRYTSTVSCPNVPLHLLTPVAAVQLCNFPGHTQADVARSLPLCVQANSPRAAPCT